MIISIKNLKRLDAIQRVTHMALYAARVKLYKVTESFLKAQRDKRRAAYDFTLMEQAKLLDEMKQINTARVAVDDNLTALKK